MEIPPSSPFFCTAHTQPIPRLPYGSAFSSFVFVGGCRMWEIGGTSRIPLFCAHVLDDVCVAVVRSEGDRGNFREGCSSQNSEGGSKHHHIKASIRRSSRIFLRFVRARPVKLWIPAFSDCAPSANELITEIATLPNIEGALPSPPSGCKTCVTSGA